MITFFSPEPIAEGVTTTLGDDAVQHARVLRIGAGEPVALRDGVGGAATGVVARLARRSLSIEVARCWQIPPGPRVHVMIPVADRDRMLLLAEKCTELAATSWRPVMWRRSRSVGLQGDGPTFNARLRGRMAAALTQSGGGWLPEIHPAATVGRAIAAAPRGTRLLLDPDAQQPITSVQLVGEVIVAIGPEGGLEKGERDEMIAAGFTPVRLAGGLLRFETAGIAALAVIRCVLDASGTGIDTRDPAATIYGNPPNE